MAHFAKLDENNEVMQVIVVNNAELIDETGQESESRGIAFCQTLFPGTTWRQTSYNGNFRKNYAGLGFTYDPDLDAFIPPKPYNSWILDQASGQWQAPVPPPNDGKMYVWDEDNLSWKLASLPEDIQG